MEAGQPVTPSITLVRLLDRGSMGSVWVADHAGLGAQVAVKLMSPEIAGQPELVTRFTREAHAAANLRSPHVVQVFDHGIAADGTPYIVMELLDGESLQKRLKRERSLDAAETAQIIGQTCKALAKAHQLGIVHRDIKPANIFLVEADGDVFVKLLDFGVAKMLGGDFSMTRTNEKVGTPYYMCPEQLISAKHVDLRADIWSVGVVAYHCLVGRVPFRAATFGDLCLVVSRGVFDPPSAVRPELSPRVDTWFLRALAKKPADRFESAKQAAEELDRAVRG